MINLLYEPFPDCIEADGRTYPVLTDFREWIRFFDLVSDPEIPEETKVSMMMQWLEEPPERITKALVDALFAFYHASMLRPDIRDTSDGGQEPPKPPVFLWSVDAKFVLGDFRRYYGVDLLTVEFMHWWEFKSLFDTLPDESCCQKRIAYRSADLSKI